MVDFEQGRSATNRAVPSSLLWDDFPKTLSKRARSEGEVSSSIFQPSSSHLSKICFLQIQLTLTQEVGQQKCEGTSATQYGRNLHVRIVANCNILVMWAALLDSQLSAHRPIEKVSTGYTL